MDAGVRARDGVVIVALEIARALGASGCVFDNKRCGFTSRDIVYAKIVRK
jgi:hypothetical protein